MSRPYQVINLHCCHTNEIMDILGTWEYKQPQCIPHMSQRNCQMKMGLTLSTSMKFAVNELCRHEADECCCALSLPMRQSSETAAQKLEIWRLPHVWPAHVLCYSQLPERGVTDRPRGRRGEESLNLQPLVTSDGLSFAYAPTHPPLCHALDIKRCEWGRSWRYSQISTSYHARHMLTLCGVHSIEVFCSVFFQKFLLPIGLHGSCSISPTAGGACQKCSTNYHN